jgi:Resolvase, N terminal domain
MSKPLVAYFRVSTREQGRSGLGIDAQRAAVARFAEAEGFEVVSEFTDVETGKGADALDRPRSSRPWSRPVGRVGHPLWSPSSIGCLVTCISSAG